MSSVLEGQFTIITYMLTKVIRPLLGMQVRLILILDLKKVLRPERILNMSESIEPMQLRVLILTCLLVFLMVLILLHIEIAWTLLLYLL